MGERPHISPEVADSFLDTVGNHELRIASSGLLLNLREPFTWQSFVTLFEKQLDNRIELPDKASFNLCRRGLVGEYGVVTPTTGGALKTASEYRIERMALTGLLSEWSVRWRDFSVQQVYGMPGRLSLDTRLSARQAPATRQAMYGSIYAHDIAGTPVSIPDISEETGIAADTVVRHVRRLEELHILHKESVRDTDCAVRVDSDCSFPLVPPGNSSGEARAFYGAVNHCGRGITSVRQLVKAAKELYPEIDMAGLNRFIRGRLFQNGGPKGVELVTPRQAGMRRQTCIQFRPEARLPMHELIKGVASLHTPERLAWYARRCAQAVRNRAVFRFLVSKGVAYPHRSSNDPQEQQSIRQGILFMARDCREGLTVRAVQEYLTSERPDHVWSVPAVRAYLDEMSGRGELDSRIQPKDPYVKTPAKVYYFTEEPASQAD